MKAARVLSGVAALSVAMGTSVVVAGSAHAASWEYLYGWGNVGEYWCAGDKDLRTKRGTGTTKVMVAESYWSDPPQGQTMQFKVIDADRNVTLGWSGWFAIPTSEAGMNVAYNVPGGTRMRLCAIFGGGEPALGYQWRGGWYY